MHTYTHYRIKFLSSLLSGQAQLATQARRFSRSRSRPIRRRRRDEQRFITSPYFAHCTLSLYRRVCLCVVCCCCGVWIGEVPPHSHNEVLTKNTYYSAPLEEALLHFTLTPQCLFPFYFCSWVYKVDAAGLGDSSFFPYTPDCVWVTVWVCVCVSVVYYSKMYECFHPAPRTLRGGGRKKVGKVTLYPSVKELGMRGALLILDPGFSHNKTRQRRRKRRRQQQKCRQRQKHCAEDQRRCWRRIAILMQNAWEIGKNQGGEMRCEETKNGAERYV